MSYDIGYKISAANINQFYANVGGLYGVGVGDMGYGQTTLPYAAPTTAGSPIRASDIAGLFALVNVCANHQGVAPNPTFGITPASSTTVAPSTTLLDTISGLFDNRFAVASPHTTTNVLTNAITTAWTGEISATFTATFISEDAARYFFNAGGAINIRIVHPNGATGPDTEWRYACASDIGTISFKAHGTTNTGTAAASYVGFGYYELIDTAQELLGLSGLGNDAPYSNDVITMTIEALRLNYAGVNNSNGSGVLFTITLTDTGNKFSLSAGTAIYVDLVSCTDLAVSPPSLIASVSLAPSS